MSLEDWVDAGLIEAVDERVRGAVRIQPNDEALLLASDWPAAAERPMRSDHVLGAGPTAALLANATVPAKLGSMLDLGCGCGIQALLAAPSADHVVATDLNPRAVGIAAFNAALNGLDVECLEGDLFEPVSGRRFDLIVTNPPFAISPEMRYLYRDSELGGEGIVRKLISSAPEFLTEGGYCQVLCNWPHFEGREWKEDLRRTLAATKCSAWVLALGEFEPDMYASGWIRQTLEGDRERFGSELDEWLRFLERQRITAVSFLFVTMRRTSGLAWFDLDELDGGLGGPVGAHLLRCFQARETLAGTGDEELLGLRPRVAEDVRLAQELAPKAEGWTAIDSRLKVAVGLPFSGVVDAHVANLLVRCDGSRRLREILAASAAEANADAGIYAEEGLEIVKRLLRRGFVTI
jgi:SAM-dependent methyltransferase